MAGINLKVQVLRKSVATFCGWLDNCDQLLVAIPTELEKCPSTKLRELAMKYKVTHVTVCVARREYGKCVVVEDLLCCVWT